MWDLKSLKRFEFGSNIFWAQLHSSCAEGGLVPTCKGVQGTDILVFKFINYWNYIISRTRLVLYNVISGPIVLTLVVYDLSA